MPDSPVSLRIPNVLTYEKTIPTLCPTYEVMKMRNIISAHGGFLYSDHRYGEVSVGLVITAPDDHRRNLATGREANLSYEGKRSQVI